MSAIVRSPDTVKTPSFVSKLNGTISASATAEASASAAAAIQVSLSLQFTFIPQWLFLRLPAKEHARAALSLLTR